MTLTKHFLLPLLLSLPLLAQPTITQQPVIVEKGHAFFTPYWETNVAGTNRVEYGLTSAYGKEAQIPKVGGDYGFQTDVRHGLAVVGLEPNTTYHYRVCTSSNANQACNVGTNCVCSGDQTVTTDPLPATHPEAPVAPDVSSVAVAMPPPPPNGVEWDFTPSGMGRVVSINAQCQTASGLPLSQVLTALGSLNGTGTMEIRINPAAQCLGHFRFPPRNNHNDWVVVRSSASDAQLPPAGVQVRDEFLPYMPSFKAATSWALNVNFAFTPNTCKEGELFFPIGITTGFPLYHCGPGGATGQTSKNIVDYSAGVFTLAPGHGYQSGEILDFFSSGLGVDNSRREITFNGANTFTINGWTPTGTWTGAGTVIRRGAWRHISYLPFLSGTVLPATCTEGTWFYKTNATPNTDAGYLCTSTNTWTWYQVRNINLGALEYATVHVPSGASKYRFVGLNITRQPGLQTPPASAGVSQRWNLMASLASVDKGASDIVFDRVILDGLGYPQRTSFGFSSFDGARTGLLNSRVRNIDWWTTTASILGVYTEATAINVGAGPGPSILENNYLEATGITFFVQDGGAVGMQPKNFLFRRNYLTKKLSTMRGRPENTLNLFYGNRHAFELKRGSIFKVTGNRFVYSWSGASDPNAGEFLMLTPTSASPSTSGLHQTDLTITSAIDSTVTVSISLSSDWTSSASKAWVRITGTTSHNGVWRVASASGNQIHLLNGPTGTSSGGNLKTIVSVAEVSDIDVSFNTMQHGPGGVSGIGFHNWSSGPLPNYLSKRWRFSHNILRNFDFRGHANGGWVASGYGHFTNGSLTKVFAMSLGIQDLMVHNNVVDGVQANTTSSLFYLDSGVTDVGIFTEGAVVKNNMVLAASNVQSINVSNSIYGDAALPKAFYQPSFTSNVFCCNLTTPQVSSNGYAASESVVAPFNRSRMSYRRKSTSSYPNQGPDIEGLDAEQGLVANARVRRLAGGSAVVSYKAPDAAACTVEYSSSPTWGTGLRISDGGGNRLRNVTLSGLTAGTMMYYRVLCAVEQPAGSFLAQ